MTRAYPVNSGEQKELILFRNIASYMLLACGAVYFISGILCIGFLKRSRQKKEVTMEQVAKDLQELQQRREELEALLITERFPIPDSARNYQETFDYTNSEAKEMDEVYKGLNEVKAEMEKLKEENSTKTELCESLRKVHNDQLLQLQEAKLQIEKQAQELNAKSEEISDVRQKYEDLKASLHEKESCLTNLSSANEKLRDDYGEKIQKLEGENKELALALDKATSTIQDFKSKIGAGNEEIEGLKRLLSVAQKKCLEAEEKAKASKELKQRDDMILKLEEENSNVQDQLKWRNEQFKHLEEAHEKLQDQFRLNKAEWETEKLTLVEKIDSLQASLDSQTRISESLHNQLKMCNQALAHEESKRKILEIEVSEFKSRFENVFQECQEAKSIIEKLTLEGDNEIAKLRNSLGTKEMLSKEMEFRIAHLEQENMELRGSLKEFQKDQINNAGATSSLKKLQNKLRGLEQLHSKCSMNLKEKEAEWSSQMEKMTGDMNAFISKLNAKEKQIQELQESSHCSLEVQNEEVSVIIMCLKSEFSAAYSKLSNAKAEIEECNKEREGEILLLTEQLKIKDNALQKAHVDLMQARKELASSMERVLSWDLMKQQQTFMEDELERHKKMLDESSEHRLWLKEQVLQLENALKEGSTKVSDVLEKANSELAEKNHEVNQMELELQKWKSIAENRQVYLEENQEVFKKEKESLLSNLKKQDEKIGDLQRQIVLLESTVAANVEAVAAFKQEKENYRRIAEDKDNSIENLQKEIAWLKEESAKIKSEGIILAQLEAEKSFEHEKERLVKIIKAKDQCMEDLWAHATSLEQDLTNAVIFSFTEVIEKQIEIDVLNEDLEEAQNLKKFEIQIKDNKIMELEKVISDSLQKLTFQEEHLSHSKRKTEQFEALFEANKLEIEKLKDQFGNERKCLEDLVKKLEFEKFVLLEDTMKLSTEREDLLVQFEGICDRTSEFSGKDAELMAILGKILQNSEKNGMNLIVSDELNDPPSPSKIVSSTLSPSTKGIEENWDRRSPLKELNH
ncbi:hypothetical protein F0562_020887 [Nyssa sinensis]|uniref:Uncharacterized protein n=1 Tax=Nyssa sinensis TaxID=561372 RepID=A0A5J5BVQ1_9ASTE|nr:hypothetical protein F0562_020887 [Nyssa sinensis]